MDETAKSFTEGTVKLFNCNSFLWTHFWVAHIWGPYESLMRTLIIFDSSKDPLFHLPNKFYWFHLPINRTFTINRHCPFHCIDDDSLDFFIMIGWIGLMTRPKIKHFSISTFVCTPAAEYFSAFKPADENELIWLRNIKWLSIHFFPFQFNVLWDSFSNWVAWIHNPKTFFFIRHSPLQITACPH